MTNIITFPKLGFSLNLSPVAFTIGTKEVYWYALIILFGFLVSILLVSLDSEKRGLSKDSVLDIALWGMVSGVICARIYYVLFSLDEFRGDWLGIFRIWESGIAIYGAIIGAKIASKTTINNKSKETIAILFFFKRRQESCIYVSDVPTIFSVSSVGLRGTRVNFSVANISFVFTSSVIYFYLLLRQLEYEDQLNHIKYPQIVKYYIVKMSKKWLLPL